MSQISKQKWMVDEGAPEWETKAILLHRNPSQLNGGWVDLQLLLIISFWKLMATVLSDSPSIYSSFSLSLSLDPSPLRKGGFWKNHSSPIPGNTFFSSLFLSLCLFYVFFLSIIMFCVFESCWIGSWWFFVILSLESVIISSRILGKAVPLLVFVGSSSDLWWGFWWWVFVWEIGETIQLRWDV